MRVFLLSLLLSGLACSLPPLEQARDAGAVDTLAPDAAIPADLAPDARYTWPARWHVSRGFIRDDKGRAVIMRGMNLAGSHKSAPYFGFHVQADFDRVSKDWGMNSIRLLFSWSAVEPNKGQYDQAFLTKLAQRVSWAQKAGLLVVLDSHQDVYGPGFGGNGAPRWTCSDARYKEHKPVSPWFLNYTSPPVMACFDDLFSRATLGQSYAEMWRQVAAKLKGYPNIVGFDVMNEPHWGTHNVFTFEKERLQPFYGRVVKAVRAETAGWIAFLEPANSRNMGIKTSLVRPTYADTVYAPHSYDTLAEQGNGFDEKRRKAVISNLAALAAEAKDLGSALWIGEYGGIADHKGIAAYMDANYDGVAAVAGSQMYWDYGKGGGYAPMDAAGKEKETLLDTIVRPFPLRVAGDPVSYGFDEKSGTFTLIFSPTAAITAPTLISVPARTYPKGYTVSCGGCTHAASGSGVLSITTPPSGSPATVTVAPKP